MEDNSSTLAILKYFASKLKELGAETYMADIKKLNLPIFSYKALKSLKNEKFRILAENIKKQMVRLQTKFLKRINRLVSEV